MKRLPARIGLSGISYECPDGSNGLLRWTELTAFEKTIRPNPLLRRDKDRLPTQIIASSNRIGRLAALLRERQIRNEIQLKTHLQEWKLSSVRPEAVIGIFSCVGAPAVALYFLSTIAMNYVQRSSVMAEVDALMPWWYWASLSMACLFMFSIYVVLPCLFGLSILRTVSKNRATRVITDTNGITARLRSGEVVSSPWREISRIHVSFVMTLVVPGRTIHISPLARGQFLSIVKSAILKSHGDVGAAKVFGRKVSDRRPKNVDGISKRLWWTMTGACTLLSGTLYLQRLFLSPDRTPSIIILFVPWLLIPFVVLVVLLEKRNQSRMNARHRNRSPLTLTACF